mgnify:FL=1
MIEKSDGHIAFAGEFEFFWWNGEVFRAKISTPIDAYGARPGRFESTAASWQHFGEMTMTQCRGEVWTPPGQNIKLF